MMLPIGNHYQNRQHFSNMTITEYRATNKPSRNYAESKEQGTIAGYLSKYHPNIIFETVEREGNRSFRAQNSIKKNNSMSGWPDTRIYHSSAGYHSLMIENKKAGTELFQVKKRKFAKRHYENQYKCHLALIDRGHAVYFGIGISNVIEIIERYISGNLKQFDNFAYISWDANQETEADNFFKGQGL